MATKPSTNTDIAARLGLAHSTVSRMRSGARVGSVRTLCRISSEFDIPLEKVMTAADKALAGDKDDWVKLINGLDATPAGA